MIASDIKTRTIVGLEIHVQLATRTKMFCGCELVFGAEPNTRTCPVCLGLPGSLPVINRQAVEFSVKMGLALGCRVGTFTKWDRKSYYYPDLPKNYQISQYDLPLNNEGRFEIPDGKGGTKFVRILRAHLEEDAGKNVHDVPGCSLVDLNRAGTPLLEIVTEPDISSGDEAYAFCTELQRLVTHLGIGEGSMQKGQMRFEPNVNVEIEHNGEKYYTPIVEVKNLNSFRAVRDAIEFESRRHVQDWLANHDYVKGKAPSENRGWNADKGITEFQRGKEAAHDYRYFPDPDLVPVTLTPEWIESVKAGLPEMPLAREKRFLADYGISEKDVPVILGDLETGILYEYCVVRGAKPATVTKQFMGIWNSIATARDTSIGKLGIAPENYFELAQLVEEGAISATAAGKLVEKIAESQEAVSIERIRALADQLKDADKLNAAAKTVGLKELAEKNGLIQVQDENAMLAWVEQVFTENEQAVQDALSNPKKAKAAPGFLTGKVMQVSKGKADPKAVGKLIRDKLDELKKN